MFSSFPTSTTPISKLAISVETSEFSSSSKFFVLLFEFDLADWSFRVVYSVGGFSKEETMNHLHARRLVPDTSADDKLDTANTDTPLQSLILYVSPEYDLDIQNLNLHRGYETLSNQ